MERVKETSLNVNNELMNVTRFNDVKEKISDAIFSYVNNTMLPKEKSSFSNTSFFQSNNTNEFVYRPFQIFLTFNLKQSKINISYSTCTSLKLGQVEYEKLLFFFPRVSFEIK